VNCTKLSLKKTSAFQILHVFPQHRQPRSPCHRRRPRRHPRRLRGQTSEHCQGEEGRTISDSKGTFQQVQEKPSCSGWAS
jgi:hypothetical protein